MNRPIPFQVWCEDGFLALYADKQKAIEHAKRDHEYYNSYTTVYQSSRPRGRPDDSTIVWRAEEKAHGY